MAVNKNFVVKNGLEVDTNLILANAETNKVGIGTSIPEYTLHVLGGVGATDARITGVATVLNELRVGTGGTIFSVIAGPTGFGQSVGVGTAQPAFLLDVRSPVSIGQTAFYVQGDARFTGNTNIQNDVDIDGDINVGGISTFVGFSTFNDYVHIQDGLVNAGVTTSNAYTIDGTQVISSSRELQNIASLDAITTATIEAAISNAPNTFTDITVTGVSTFIGIATFSSGIEVVSGVTTIGGYVDINNSVDISTDLNVVGLTTLGGYVDINDSVDISTDLNVVGLTTLGGFVDIIGNVDVGGNLTIGGTFFTVNSQDVYIANKDIILGFTTAITPNDDTANHAGIAIASTEGSPLTSFAASGINTLPDTYKQLMWFKSGTLGFSTDAFAFNYGVAIGTTTMADGVRLAVGSSVTITDTTVNAVSFVGDGSGLTGVATGLTGTIGVGSESTFVGAGVTEIYFATTTGTNVNVVAAGTSATVTITPGVSLGLAIALGG